MTNRDPMISLLTYVTIVMQTTPSETSDTALYPSSNSSW